MCDTREILAAAAGLRAAGEDFMTATVVRVLGSGYRRPGARMLLTSERWVAGSLGGGWLEADVVRKDFWRTREQRAVLLSYGDSAPDELRSDQGLGGGGAIDVLLERSGDGGAEAALGFVRGCLRAQRRGVLATVVRSDDDEVPVGAHFSVRADGACAWDVRDRGARAWIEAEARAALAAGPVATGVRSAGPLECFIEVVVPPPHLFVLGSDHDAVPVVQMARTLGWHVVVVEPRARFATRERFLCADEVLVGSPATVGTRIDACDRAAALIMGHSYQQDREYLALLLGSRARYIGLLGPRRRAGRLLDELGLAGLEDVRLHAPVGLELGADTPAELALAMLAEVQAALTGASALRRRERPGSIQGEADVGEADVPTSVPAVERSDPADLLLAP